MKFYFDIKADIHLHDPHSAQILEQGNRIMAALDDIKAEVAEIRTNNGDMATALAGIGARIDALIAQLAAQQANGLTPEQVAEALTELRSVRGEQQTEEDKAAAIAAGTP